MWMLNGMAQEGGSLQNLLLDTRSSEADPGFDEGGFG